MLFHDLTFAGSFIVDAAQMQYSVDDHTEQFSIIRFSPTLCIGCDGFEGDEHIAVDLATARVIESNNICVIIVGEEFSINIEYFFVVTKNICKLADYPSVLLGYLDNPLLDLRKITEGEVDAPTQPLE